MRLGSEIVNEQSDERDDCDIQNLDEYMSDLKKRVKCGQVWRHVNDVSLSRAHVSFELECVQKHWNCYREAAHYKQEVDIVDLLLAQLIYIAQIVQEEADVVFRPHVENLCNLCCNVIEYSILFRFVLRAVHRISESSFRDKRANDSVG